MTSAGDPLKPNPVAARRRYVRETMVLVLAIVVAIFGQGFVADRAHPALMPGVALLAIAALLSLWLRGSVRSDRTWRDDLLLDSTPESQGPTRDERPLDDRGIAFNVPFGIVAVVSGIGALLIFAVGQGVVRNVAWFLYLLSIPSAIVAVWNAYGSEEANAPDWTRRDSVLLGLIALVAAFFRLWHIDSLPWGLWFDEATHGLEVLRILRDPAYRPIFLESSFPEPALHWYFDAIFFLLFGPTQFAIRVSAVIAGILGAIAAYLLARELFGWRTAVVAGFFLAVASWHVNFSRLMFNAIWSTTLDTFAAYFLVKGFRTRHPRHFALAGLFLGLGLNNYYASRLFVVVTIIFVLFKLVTDRRAFLHSSLNGVAVLGLFLLVSGGPLIEYGLLNPVEFNARVAEVSIFGEINRAHSLNPLLANVERHLVMFNYAGDLNGRHNLAGSPELDQVMAALFVLGIALSLRRLRHAEHALLLIWLPLILLGGIFSLSFEAPQSLRTLDDSVVSVLIASVPLGALWARFGSVRLANVRLPASLGGPAAFSLGALGFLCLFGWSAGLDYQKYFVLQANSFVSWNAFSTSETEVGRAIGALDLAKTDVYLDPVLLGQPTINFLAPRYSNEVQYDPVDDLPLHDQHNVAIFLTGDRDRMVGDIRRLYPQATIRPFSPPFGGPVVLYSVHISAGEVASLQGLAADYYSGRETTGKPTVSTRDPLIDFDWAKSKPPLDPPFTVSWRGVLSAPTFGSYLLKINGPDTSQLYLDESLVLQGTEDKSVTLARGSHVLRLVTTVGDSQTVQLLWRTPGAAELVPVPRDALFAPAASSRGLLGKYYRGLNWQGQPANEQIDPTLEIQFHFLPLQRPYSVEWSGKIDIPTDGVYVFGTQSIDSSWIFVDGQQIATNQGHPDEYAQGAIRLKNGLHDLKVRFQDDLSFSYIKVFWQPPGFPREVIPSDRLFPPQGAYPERAGPLKSPVLVTTSQPSQSSPTAPSTMGAAPPSALPIAPLKLIRAFGSPGSGPGQFKSPRGIAVDAKDNLYVVDTGNARVEKFAASGQFLLSWGSAGEGQEQFVEPVDVVVDSSGQVIVLDSTTGWLKAFQPDGKFIRQFGGPSLGMYHPRGLSIGQNGNFFIADAGTSHVVELSPRGDLISKLGEKGSEPGQIMEPVSVAAAPDGTLYVTDTALFRLTHVDSALRLIHAWDIPKSSSVIGPHVWVAADRSFYVSDPEGHRVVHYLATGEPTEQLGASGQLNHPVGVVGDAQGNLYVADADGNRVYEYGIP